MVPKSKSEVNVSVPERVGKYRLVGQIGHGGMADVFLAVASGPGGFNKLHVLKLLRSDIFDSQDGVRAFKDEARLAALLNHPNVVQTYEVGEDDGNVYMVLEYLEGETLQGILSYIRRNKVAGGLGLDLRIRVVADILSGLHYTHELRDLAGQPLNLVHRDVSPHNIFITYDGGVKLLDFGIAKTTSASSTTHAGTIKGKVAYMAPEQVSNPNRISRKTDIFQVGLILWEGIIGRRIWEGLSDCDVLIKLANNVGCAAEAPADADPELVRICQRAIAISPDHRYATAEEFASDLESFMVARGIRTRSKDVGNFVAKLFSSHRQALREVIQRRLSDIESASGLIEHVQDGVLPHLYSQSLTGNTESSRRGTFGSSARSNILSLRVSNESNGFNLRTFARWKLAISAAVAGTLVALGVYATKSDSQPTPESPSSARSNEQLSGTIELSISASPPHARLFLDNSPLPSNPFHGQVMRDRALHLIRAEATGYEPTTLNVHFDRDTDNTIVLPPSPQRAQAPSAPETTTPTPTTTESHSNTKVTGTRSTKGPVVMAARVSPPRQPSNSNSNAKSNQVAAPAAAPAAAPTPAVKLDNADPWR